MQQYRYPGTRPFTANDRNLFFGRNEDIVNLSNLIALEEIVVLYGKSGLGKTSLLNAGVIPALKENGNYETFTIRFGAYIRENQFTPIDIFKNSIQNKEQQNNLIYNKLIAKDQITQHFLWYSFKDLQFTKSENSCFIVVFDQFEELFTYPETQIEQFKKELSELLNVKIPQQLRNILKDKLVIDKEYLTKEETVLFYKSLNIKIVFAIRSDRMSFLNRMTDYLPNILKKCFELQPLNNEQAVSAIVEPAKKQEFDFISRPFLFDEPAIIEIIDFLSKNGQQKIETFLLQILCQYIENNVIKNNINIISKNNLGVLQNISKNFYDNIIAGLPEKDREKARILLEEGLILENEERRLTLYEGQIYKQFNISKELLLKLVDTHILRSEPFHSGGFMFEISHDTLVLPILSAKNKRKEKEKKIKFRKRIIISGIAVTSFLFIFLIVFMIVWQTKKNAYYQEMLNRELNEKLNTTINNYVTAYPILITNLSFKNSKDDKISDTFNKYDLEYLLPLITYKNLSSKTLSGDIYIKIFIPDGSLSRNTNSPEYFTYISSETFSTETDNTIQLGGWGSKSGGAFGYGLHRVEIWYNDKCIFFATFKII